MEFAYEVEYRPGTKHSLAPAMSRLSTAEFENRPADDEVPWYVVEVGYEAQPEEYSTVLVWWEERNSTLKSQGNPRCLE